MLSRRHLLLSALATGLVPDIALAAAKPSEIRIDWATDNPVSMVLKEKGLLEKEFEKDGIGIRWVQKLLGFEKKALEFSTPARSILAQPQAPPRSLAGSMAIRSNRSTSIRPEWTALVTRKDVPITKIADLKGKRVAVTRGTDPHIFLVRALQSVGLGENDIVPVLLQHPDGKIALDSRRR